MQLAIRADGGPEIGFGHLIRSKALAEEFLERGHEVIVTTTTPQSAQSVFPNSIGVTELPLRGDPEPFVDWIDAILPDVVFTDSYEVDTEYQRAISDRVPLTVLQDDERHSVCADLFVNGNLYAPDLNYQYVGEKPKTCLGTDYVLLRSEIRERARDEPPWQKNPERALVIMGGSDIADLMPTVLYAFDGFDIHVDAIVGPGFSERQERSVRTAAKEISPNVSVTRDPDDLAERIFQADFAVSTSSSTTYELLALGTPIISIPVAENQKQIASSLRERDVATVLGRGADKKDFRRSIETYISSSETRRTYRNLGRQMVDGRGVERIYAEVLSTAEDDS